MPYMHWDTDRQRDRFAREIDTITANYKDKRVRKMPEDKLERQNLRERIHGKRPSEPRAGEPQQSVPPFETLAAAMGIAKRGLPLENGRLLVKNRLGQYLIDAARLYEAMSAYKDRKLLRTYLAAEPPLHPRRTLDQAYYWTLNT